MPGSFMRLDETADVSAVELTEMSVIALVLSLAPSSMVKRLIIPATTRFLTRLLTADSDNPISFAMSTNAFLESSWSMRIILSSVPSMLAHISPLFLPCQYTVHYFNCAGNRRFVHDKWRKQAKDVPSRVQHQQSLTDSVEKHVPYLKAKLDAKHHAKAPDLPDYLVALLEAFQLFLEELARFCSIIDKAVLSQGVHRCGCGGAGKRACAKGRR